MTHRIITGDCIEEMRNLDKVDVCIFDPPYSAHVQDNIKSVRGKGAKDGGGSGYYVDLKFDAIGFDWMQKCAVELARIVKRWVLVFCGVEASHEWIAALQGVGFDYVRTGAWVRKGAPQLTGDRPGCGYDSIVICHPKGRKRWNGGGTDSVWSHGTLHGCRPCGSNNTREHPTQKPLPLMIELVSLFSDPGETVLDCTCGAGSTGVAAVRLGRHFIGIEQQEKWATIARERCAAEDQGSDVVSYRAGQLPLLGAR